MDVDGTLTDGKIYMGNTGEIMKAFDVKDGYGIHNLAISSGIIPIIITGRKSQILEKRCMELGIINIFQGVKEKIDQLIIVAEDLSTVAYIGDDVNDLLCMQKVKEAGGCVGCPADAIREIIKIADFVSTKNGGNGAVREFIDWIIGDV